MQNRKISIKDILASKKSVIYKTDNRVAFCIGFCITCLIFTFFCLNEVENMREKVRSLEETNYTLEQNNIDLRWQLGEVGKVCQGGYND